MRLRDVVAPDLRLLLVGINPGLRSGQLGHHFAGKTNPFWRLLFAARLIPEPITWAEDRRLLQWRIGLTNLCPRTTRAAAELTVEELAAGARALERKVARLRPRALALVGLTLHQQIFRRRAGAGPSDERLAGVPLFVLPNPSGLNASFPGFQHKLVWFEQLRGWLDELV